MREQLHRAKRTDNSEWVYGNYCETENLDGKETEHFIIEKEANGSQHLVFSKTVGEFSGLRDIRYKRIFEDDLLKDDNGFVYRVVFEAGAFCLVAVTEFNIPYDTLPKDPDLEEFEGNLADNIVPIYVLKWNNTDWHNSFEIIGNLHDNPELLEHRIRKL